MSHYENCYITQVFSCCVRIFLLIKRLFVVGRDGRDGREGREGPQGPPGKPGIAGRLGRLK